MTTQAGIDDVMPTGSFLDHVVEKRRQYREKFANFVLPSLRDPAEVWLQARERYRRILYEPAFVTAFEGADTVAVARQDPKHGWLSWTFYPARNDNERRAGYLRREG